VQALSAAMRTVATEAGARMAGTLPYAHLRWMMMDGGRIHQACICQRPVPIQSTVGWWGLMQAWPA